MTTNATQSFVAIVSVSGRPVHVLGPFAAEAEAARQGREVAGIVDAFAPVGSDDYASVSVLPMAANVDGLFSMLRGSMRSV